MTEDKGTRVQNAIKTTDVIRAADPLQAFDAQPLDHEPAPVPYVKEPLFSKRVLVGWALGTLVAWFGLTVIVPAVFHSVRSAVVSTITPQDDGTTVIETRNGTRVTIRRGRDGGITVDRERVGSPTTVTVPPPDIAPLPPLPPEPTTGKK